MEKQPPMVIRMIVRMVRLRMLSRIMMEVRITVARQKLFSFFSQIKGKMIRMLDKLMESFVTVSL